MYNYRNVFDKESGFMRGRLKDGSWLAPLRPLRWGGPYCEGNAWHYNWSVFHDVQGAHQPLRQRRGVHRQDRLVFTVPNVIRPGTYGGMIHEMKEMELAGMGQYAHGNQPIQHMIYLYSYAGQPWKTQYWSRQITGRLYNSSERGYPGDEDQGGMSSWYILSSLGIYSVCPGTDQYVLAAPCSARRPSRWRTAGSSSSRPTATRSRTSISSPRHSTASRSTRITSPTRTSPTAASCAW